MDIEQEPRVQVVERAGNGLLVLRGSIDITCVEDLRQAALQLLEHGRHTTACCEQVDYIDTAALQILLALKTVLAAPETAFQLEGVSSQMVDLLHLTGFYAAVMGDGPQPAQPAETTSISSAGEA
jgi:anti-anti-sigma factor